LLTSIGFLIYYSIYYVHLLHIIIIDIDIEIK